MLRGDCCLYHIVLYSVGNTHTTATGFLPEVMAASSHSKMP